jgi:hypothetical protein
MTRHRSALRVLGRKVVTWRAAEQVAVIVLGDVVAAIADTNPAMSTEECIGAALDILEGAASLIRSGEFTMAYQPHDRTERVQAGAVEFARQYREARGQASDLTQAITEAAMTETATARQARTAYRKQRQAGRDETGRTR